MPCSQLRTSCSRLSATRRLAARRTWCDRGGWNAGGSESGASTSGRCAAGADWQPHQAEWLGNLPTPSVAKFASNHDSKPAAAALFSPQPRVLHARPRFSAILSRGRRNRTRDRRTHACALRARLTERKAHYAKADLLESQLATLEKPRDAIAIDANGSSEQTVRQIRDKLAARLPVA